MDDILSECRDLCLALLGQPESAGAIYIAGIVAALVLVLLINKVGNLFNFPLATGLRVILFTVLAGAILIGSAAAANVHLEPKIANAFVKAWLPLIVAVVLVPAVVVPLMMLIFKARYVGGLICLGISLAGAAVAVLLAYAVLDAFSGGSTEMEKTRENKDAVMDLMGN